MEDYIEKDDSGFAEQLHEHADAMDTYGILLGFVLADIDGAEQDADFFTYLLARQEAAQTFPQVITDYKNLARYGNGTDVLMATIPEAEPNPLPLPVVTLANIEARFRSRANRAKAHPAYTQAIGEALKIVRAETVFVPEDGTASFKVKVPTGGQPALKIKIGKYHGADIYRMITTAEASTEPPGSPPPDAAFQKLERVIGSKFTDNTPLPPFGKAEVWHYKIRYVYKNQPVGNVSAIISVTVTGV